MMRIAVVTVIIAAPLAACGPQMADPEAQSYKICREGEDCSVQQGTAALAASGPSVIRWQDEEGYRGELLQALEERTAAGDVTAAYKLGLLHRYGTGGAAGDKDNAAKAFAQASEAGHVSAAYELALIQKEDAGSDPVKQSAWRQLMLKAADGGHPGALLEAGKMHQDGQGFPVNPGLAASYFAAAAENELVEAQFLLGQLLFRGHGARMDTGRALTVTRDAALNGHSKAQLKLGVLYARGFETIAPDRPEARKWLMAAAANGELEAKEILEAIDQERPIEEAVSYEVPELTDYVNTLPPVVYDQDEESVLRKRCVKISSPDGTAETICRQSVRRF